MSLTCPYCKAVLNPKGLKPGKYQPKCPGCKKAFLLEVASANGRLSARISAIGAGGPVQASPKPVQSAKPPLDEEERAARMLADETGDFTEPDASPPPPKRDPKPAPPQAPIRHDPEATGDFTEPEASPPPPPPPPPSPRKSAPQAPPASRRHEPEATGDFTEAADGRNPADATGDFTEAETGAEGAESPDRTRASDSDENFEVSPRPSSPKKKARTEPEAEPLGEDIPDKLGGYEVLKVLGKGGMGAVLLGRQVSLNRNVALKVMHPRIAKNPGFVARFTREAYAAAQLTHHNVIQIYDIGEDRGQHFFSMEFVPGQSLMETVRKEGKLAPEAAVGYILQAARGLRYGHKQGMVHRDIKPDNLMLNTEGIVKVADLGLVKLPSGDLPQQAGQLPPDDEDGEGEGKTELTRAGAVMGTPAYMPPEQARDSATVDQRADIYSLGCTLYVLITGKPPFEGKTALEIISKHQTQPITPPEVVVKRVPKALSEILLKMMAKSPDDRFQTMDEVIAALEGFLGVQRSGPFNPSEQEADELEKYVHQFNFQSRAGLKRMLAMIFVAVCVLGIVGCAASGMPTLAGGIIGLFAMTPIAYFMANGLLSGSVVFTRFRALIFGMRLFDWLLWFAGGVLLIATLFLFGLIWAWIGFAALAAILGLATWAATDRAQEKGQEAALEGARTLFRALRSAGIEEDVLRQFVCKYSGTNWEPFYEGLFGYEAKLAAREYRKGNTGEVWKKAGAWREPVIGWIEGRLEARRVARERQVIQKVEEKALEAEGANRADAKAQAAAMAADLVEGAAEVKEARKQGKDAAIVRDLYQRARERKKPKPGYNIAGVPLKNLWFKDFLNDWFGRRLRFAIGAILFALGLLWMNQNGMLKKEASPLPLITAFKLDELKKWFEAPRSKPLAVSFIPSAMTEPVNSFAVPATGLLMIFAGAFYFGWKPSLTAVPGAAIALLGPSLGIPALGPLSPAALSLAIGAVLIVVVSHFLRK